MSKPGVCKSPRRRAKGARYTGAGVTGSCKLSNPDAGPELRFFQE